MERYCGTLRRAIRSRRFPFASLDRFVTESAQLAQIINVYDIADDLSLRPPPGGTGEFSDPRCKSYFHFYSYISLILRKDPTCVLLPPKSTNRPAENALSSIASALATRFDVSIAVAKRHLQFAEISEWGGIRRVDSTAGDTMRASSLGIARKDSRDATYVRVRCSLFSHVSAFPDSAACGSTKFSSTNIPDRHVVNPVTTSKRSTVNYNTSMPSSSAILVKILVSIPPSRLSWQLSRVALSRTLILKPGVWTFGIIREKVLFILLMLNACSVWWGGYGTGIGGQLLTGVVPWRELCILRTSLNNEWIDAIILHVIRERAESLILCVFISPAMIGNRDRIPSSRFR